MNRSCRRRLKYSLRGLLILTAVSCVFLALAAWLLSPFWLVRPAVRDIRKFGGVVGPRSIVNPFFIPSTNNVTQVDFCDTGLDDDGLKAVTHSLSSLPRLRILILSNTRVSDDGVQHLIELRGLEYLYIDGTMVSDAGKRYLQEKLLGLRVFGGRPNNTEAAESDIHSESP